MQKDMAKVPDKLVELELLEKKFNNQEMMMLVVRDVSDSVRQEILKRNLYYQQLMVNTLTQKQLGPLD